MTRFLARLLGMLLAVTASNPAAAAKGALVWGDALEPGSQPRLLLPVAGFAKAAVSTAPASLNWLILRCRFPDSPDYEHTAERTRWTFDAPDHGLFAYFDRQSQSKMQQSIAGIVDAVLPQPRTAYLALPTHQFIEQTTAQCLDAARASGALSGMPFDALGVFYNDALDCCAYAGQYPLHEGSDTRYPTMWIPPLAAESTAILAHEMAHSLGLPHSNNSDGDFDHTDNYWDPMSQVTWNSVFERPLGFLPKALHARQRWQLGWLDADQANLVQAFEGNDRSESFTLLSGELIRIALDGERELVVTFRDVSPPDAGLRETPAVFLDTYDPARFPWPLWAVDAATPMPNITNTDSSLFTTGETWTWHEQGAPRDVTVEVVSTSLTLAQVVVHLGPPPFVFANSFEPNALGETP